MWFPWKRRKHLGAETLSEHLDGRLSLAQRQRMERHLEGCAECRLELSSLEQTVGLLRRVPAVAPTRSFTLQAVPVEALRPARAPTWAFSAAAASFALLFAAVLSADLGGILAGEAEPAAEDAAVSREFAPAPTPEPELLAEQEMMLEAPAAAPAPAPMEAGAEERVAAAPAAEPEEAIPEADLETEVAAAAPALAPADQIEAFPAAPSEPEEAGTAILWRVLEGVLGALALALLGGILWRRRRARQQATP